MGYIENSYGLLWIIDSSYGLLTGEWRSGMTIDGLYGWIMIRIVPLVQSTSEAVFHSPSLYPKNVVFALLNYW